MAAENPGHDSPSSGRGRLVLVGAGHAHLDAIRHAHSFTRRGFALTVVAPGPFWYSGLATGMLGGEYAPEDDQVDVERLVHRGGGRFVRDRVRAIDHQARTIGLEAGGAIPYDVVSLNPGSEVPTWTIPGLDGRGIAVKPIENLLRLRDLVTSRLAGATAEHPVRIVVIGGGATACEVAANLCALARRDGGRADITLVARGDRLMRSWPEGAGATVSDSLRARGVAIRLGSPVIRVEDGRVLAADGSAIAFDVLVAAIGLVASRLVGTTGLPRDESGALIVDEHLRSIADPRVFGGGDCVAPGGHSLPRVGVHGVRQAPILRHNLMAALDGRPPWAYRSFRPQRHFLQIMNLGDGTGLAAWGPWSWHGRLALSLKDRIDRGFVASSRSCMI
jgi:NADH dehydrogenase FAD-containing subunit